MLKVISYILTFISFMLVSAPFLRSETGVIDKTVKESGDETVKGKLPENGENRSIQGAGEYFTGINWLTDWNSSDNWNFYPRQKRKREKTVKVEKNSVRAAKKSPVQNTDYGITPALNFGFTFPSFAYGERYKNTPGYSLSALMERYRYLKFVPEAVFRYGRLESRDREGKVDSAISLSQFSLGVRYNYNVKIPLFFSRSGFFKSPVTLYVRGSEGITRVSFTSDQVTTPIVEYINTIELSAGFTCPVYRYMEMGLDFGYRHIATKEVPLQSFNLMVMVGVKV